METQMNDTQMNLEANTQQSSPKDNSIPRILLASDNPRLATPLYRTLEQDGLSVEFAPGYHELESRLEPHANAIVLLEVSEQQSVEAAVNLALRLKRRDANQFVGYLADPVLHTSGLAGDAIFSRSAHRLPGALRDYFRGDE